MCNIYFLRASGVKLDTYWWFQASFMAFLGSHRVGIHTLPPGSSGNPAIPALPPFSPCLLFALPSGCCRYQASLHWEHTLYKSWEPAQYVRSSMQSTHRRLPCWPASVPLHRVQDTRQVLPRLPRRSPCREGVVLYFLVPAAGGGGGRGGQPPRGTSWSSAA